jgi:hypothetical protein
MCFKVDMPMNDENAIKKMRALLAEMGSWTAVHQASEPDSNGILVVDHRVKFPQKRRENVGLERID